MPATEQTWRDQKGMHVIFGVSSAVMLVTTVWMFAKDHTREWKEYQKTNNRIEQFYLTGRISQEQTNEYQREVERWEAELADAQASMIDLDLVQEFKQAVRADAERREVEPPDFTTFDELAEGLPALVETAEQAEDAAAEARQIASRLIDAAQQAERQNDPNAEALRDEATQAADAAAEAEETLAAAREDAAESRSELLATLQGIRARAKFREDELGRQRKFANANLTAALSLRDLAVGNEKPAEEIAERQAEVNAANEDVALLTEQAEAASLYRRRLDEILNQMTAATDAAEKELIQARADVRRLEAGVEGFTTKAWRRVIGMPILDAFDNSDLRIDQIWLPDITINYNFSDVARFDRCITCHRSIDKTSGSATAPAYVHEQPPFTVALATPEQEPQPRLQPTGQVEPVSLRTVYGLELAEEGLIDRDDVVVKAVLPESPAAIAGLELGDVIEEIYGAQVFGREQAVDALLGPAVDWGQPIPLTIRRGLPHPFVSHPRLDLYVGSLSPHKKEEMGCTICHEGQGSGTDFKWASHSPNTPDEAEEWAREHGWFNNHHWIFPMNPQRFLESGCLKCHHRVSELEPSERYPDPPAPKLMAGYHLIREYGCFGCHEINGYDGAKRIGPDMRAEPAFFAAAQSILLDEGLTTDERSWAQRLVTHPEDAPPRHRLFESIFADTEVARKVDGDVPPRLTPETHKLGDLLKDIESPGELRKVGPSLRYVAEKVGPEFLYTWIRKPSDFRPSTKMPQFFRRWDHLDEGQQESTGLYENVELRGMVEYLLAASQQFEYLPKPEGVNVDPSAQRGKDLFQKRGCLACHSHSDFPGIKADQGPDLTGIAGKLNTEQGQKWLYTWLRQPNLYHVRTKMPNVFLDPIEGQDGEVTDPAADITAYLLSGAPQAIVDPPAEAMPDEELQALLDLAMEHLAKQFPRQRAADYLENGIPDSMAGELKGDEVALVGMTDANRREKQLLYVGRRAISKYGCAGCHDIPGYEGAKPIGTGLADWGRKEPSKLAFEQIGQFLSLHGGGHNGDPSAGHDDQHTDDWAPDNGLTPEMLRDPDARYFLEAIGHHQREGFIWQKLRQPRSYDYEKVQNKGYNERLRMPQFPLDDEAREAVITFVLGLVAEPPAEAFVYDPSPRRLAEVEGRQVLEKYNCAGCHTLEMDRWEFDYHENDFDEPPTIPDFPFLGPHFTSDEVEASLEEDRRGLRHAVVYGRPTASEETGRPLRLDEDGVPIEEGDTESEAFYSFELWKSAIINGEPRPQGLQNLQIRDSGLTKYPAWGGALADYLFPVVIAEEKQKNPQVKGGEAWGWLPPPLVGQGSKVQTDWLHDFLLDPYPIRPAVVLRMPRFNMSSAEAAKIADYFAAVDGAEYPYPDDPRTRGSHLAALEAEHPNRLGDALKILVDNNYCVKCHLVGDFVPKGSPTALAPNLTQVHRRFRPEFLRDWIANPKRILPYTGMPVNIPYKPDPPHFGGVSQALYEGTSIEQLDAVVDLLLNYDHYTIEQLSIAPLIKPAVPPPEQAAGTAEESPTTSEISNP